MLQISPTLTHPQISRKSIFWTAKTGTVTVFLRRVRQRNLEVNNMAAKTTQKKREQEVSRKAKAQEKRRRKLGRRQAAREEVSISKPEQNGAILETRRYRAHGIRGSDGSGNSKEKTECIPTPKLG